MRMATDYPTYCGGLANIAFYGRPPACGTMERTELLCGRAGKALIAPGKDYEHLAGESNDVSTKR